MGGTSPPFHIHGFLPREGPERDKALKSLAGLKAHCVLMETPYRFQAFLDQLIRVFGSGRRAFLAWEIGKDSEFYFWGSLREILDESRRRSLQKGEFVVITRAL